MPNEYLDLYGRCLGYIGQVIADPKNNEPLAAAMDELCQGLTTLAGDDELWADISRWLAEAEAQNVPEADPRSLAAHFEEFLDRELPELTHELNNDEDAARRLLDDVGAAFLARGFDPADVSTVRLGTERLATKCCAQANKLRGQVGWKARLKGIGLLWAGAKVVGGLGLAGFDSYLIAQSGGTALNMVGTVVSGVTIAGDAIRSIAETLLTDED